MRIASARWATCIIIYPTCHPWPIFSKSIDWLFLFSFFAGVLVCWCICFLLNSFLFSFSLYAIIRDGLCQVHTNSINYYCEGSEHSYEVNGNSVYIIILRTKNILK